MTNEAPRREGRRGANERLWGWGAWVGARPGLNERESHLFREVDALSVGHSFAGLGLHRVCGEWDGLKISLG